MRKKFFTLLLFSVSIVLFSQEKLLSTKNQICKYDFEKQLVSDCIESSNKSLVTIDLSSNTISFETLGLTTTYFIKTKLEKVDGSRVFTVISPSDGYVFDCVFFNEDKKVVLTQQQTQSKSSKQTTFFYQ